MRISFRNLLMRAAALLLACLAGAAVAGPSPDGLWHDVDDAAIARTAQARQLVPERYRTVRLARGSLEAVLQAAPAETRVAAARSPVSLWLPLPAGGFGEFSIVESPIMEPELAARYPELRTWLGQGIDDPTATLRFDLTPKGFHAQIISAHGTRYIDPFQPGDTDHYIAYDKRDHRRGERMRCEVTGEEIDGDTPHFHGLDNDTRLSSGDTVRSYRLAMAATGEYTQFHGGTVADGMAAIVTTMNRVNGIYEREVAVRMVLVANNDLIVYTNPVTDPYANTSGDLAANQTNINAVIGSANYDIGHLVGTGGGGVASLRSVCTASKARGLTGSGAPIGDAFDVDYVAHEIGHQFGGNHTFNGSGGNCSGGNRNASTAYEPGSGITIQAYAGICSADNLQPNSEDYFHRVSLNEIITFRNNPSTGGSCGSLRSTGNGVPSVSTGLTFTIPQQTPFELQATGSDPDGDALTYLWEQFDLGAANAAGSLVDNGTRPLFRSFAPTTDSSRVFPSLRYILANANVAPSAAPLPGTASPNWFTAELLPSTNRTMNFRVTVRDNRAGGGGTNEASTAVVVTTTAGPFRVTAPNTAISWTAGASETVSWDVAGTHLVPVATANVRILLSLDGGYSWPIELAPSVPNTGSAVVTVPADTPASSRARVRVEAVGNIWFDVSDADFNVAGTNSPPGITVSGSISTRQGSPAATAVVATVSDSQDAAGSLLVEVDDAPVELQVEVANDAGAISMTAAAGCDLVAPTNGTRTYPVRLRATDSDGASSTAFVNVLVARNLVPTLGAYPSPTVPRGSVTPIVPAAAAADGNGNLALVRVSPETLPGGGTLGAALDGTISVAPTAATTPGTYPVRVEAIDSCGAIEEQRFSLTVDAAPVVGVTIAESAGATVVAEGGASDSYTVVLTSEPDDDVTIAIAADPALEASPASLLFTPANWNAPQVVTVTAIDDRIVTGTRPATLGHSASGGGYDAVLIADVVATVVDDDSASLRFAAADSSVAEADGSATVAVELVFATSGSGAEALAAPVTVPLAVLAASTASGGGVDFAFAADALLLPVDGVIEPISIAIIDDAIAEGDETVVLGFGTATGAPPALLAAIGVGTPATHLLTIVDDDVAGVTLTETGDGTAVAEGGAGDGYSLVLDSQPTGDVQITLTPDAQLTVDPPVLLFTAANWNLPQTVDVAAVDDADAEGPHAGTIAHVASGGGYDGIAIPDLVVQIEDNDAGADLAIDVQQVPGGVHPGQPVAWEVTVSNLSATLDVAAAELLVALAPALDDLQWSCVATAGASCTGSGTGAPADTVALDRDSGLMYSISAVVPAGIEPGTVITVTATVAAAGDDDPNPANNSDGTTATVVAIRVFGDGFEPLP